MDDPVALTVPATFEDVRRLAALALETARGWGADDMVLIDLELALVEAANNIVEHGYAGAAGDIAMTVRRAAGAIEVELVDDGIEAVLAEPSVPASDEECGRGMMLIRACVDRATRDRANGRNRMVLAKSL